MSDTLHDAAERLIASMPDGVPADGIRQRARRRRRRRNITWIAAAVVVTTGGLATVRLAQQSARELVPADSAPAPTMSIAPTTIQAPASTTVPETTSPASTSTTSTTFPNRPPIAVSDLATIVEGSTVSIDVIANDFDPDGDRLRLVTVASVTGGRVTIDGDRVVVSGAEISSAVTFTYTVADESNATSAGTVIVVLVCEPTATSPGVASDACSESPMVTSPIDPTSGTGG